MRTTHLAGLVVCAALALPSSAAACSCVAIDAKSKLKTADAALVGTVTSVGKPKPSPDGVTSSGDPITVTIRVNRSYKRTFARTLRVRTAASGASCGLEPRRGERLGVVLTRTGSRWATSLCQRVKIGALDSAARELALRRRKPRAGTAAVAAARCGV